MISICMSLVDLIHMYEFGGLNKVIKIVLDLGHQWDFTYDM